MFPFLREDGSANIADRGIEADCLPARKRERKRLKKKVMTAEKRALFVLSLRDFDVLMTLRRIAC